MDFFVNTGIFHDPAAQWGPIVGLVDYGRRPHGTLASLQELGLPESTLVDCEDYLNIF